MWLRGTITLTQHKLFLSMFICGLKLLELQYLCPVLYPKGIVCSLTQSQYLEVGKNSLAYSFSIKWKKMQLNQFLKLESNQVQMPIILLLHRSRANQKTKRDTKDSYVQHSFLECCIEYMLSKRTICLLKLLSVKGNTQSHLSMPSVHLRCFGFMC